MRPGQQDITVIEDPFRMGRGSLLSEKPAAHIDAGSDAGLVTAAQRGDRSAFGCLYDRFAPMVHGIMLSRVSAADADDLVHDVFLTALRQLRSLRNASAFGGWLAQIARNRARAVPSSYACAEIRARPRLRAARKVGRSASRRDKRRHPSSRFAPDQSLVGPVGLGTPEEITSFCGLFVNTAVLFASLQSASNSAGRIRR